MELCESAPEFERLNEDAVDAAANTHVWRHGDAQTEPLSNIFQDVYMSKPGVTPLMKAAARADLESIKSLLPSTKDVDAIDSSGWTALMYAAAGSHSEPAQLLLAAGANPNHKSFAGDTPLMASAIDGSFDEDLVRAGADVNAQNSAGMTPLMILAAKGEADDVNAALKSGANPHLRDVKGRTALDYVVLQTAERARFRSGAHLSVVANATISTRMMSGRLLLRFQPRSPQRNTRNDLGYSIRHSRHHRFHVYCHRTRCASPLDLRPLDSAKAGFRRGDASHYWAAVGSLGARVGLSSGLMAAVAVPLNVFRLITKSLPMRIIYIGLGSLSLLACWDMLTTKREEVDDAEDD